MIKSDFHNAVVTVTSSFVIIPVVAGLVTFIILLFYYSSL